MLKSYKQLSRWYGPLEPETGSATPAYADEGGASALGDDDGPARYPHYILDDDPDEVRARADVPTDLPSGRSEFTGGWSDWVAGRAPGPDDDYAPPRDSGVVRFPWPEDEFGDDREERAAVSSSRALRQEARAHPSSRRARVIVVLVVAVVLLGVTAAGVVFLLRSSGDRRAAGPAPSPMHFAAGSAQADVGAKPNYATRPQPGTGASESTACPTERADHVVRSAESGGTSSGPDAVLSFQYGYYVERSGERAREVVAPEATVSPAPVIQRGIDSIPVGTRHCVRIVTITDNRYSVEITEYRPGGVPATYNQQMVTTAVVGGQTLITGIAAG
ncbi:hypothetical protein ACFQZZ_06785 [Nocardia sp. GCM10030253]|uniref:hypothetical protein n=1 Tax=Nocardia sp. GCM10030253 TaxID=3273404 RepID=UPI003627F079